MDIEKVLRSKRQPHFEQINFETDLPCRIKKKTFKVNSISTLHYATTMEIIIADRLDGVVTIGASRYNLNPKGRHVFVVSPNVVHSTFYRASDGCEYVFKISFDLLSRYLNTEEIFSAAGFSFEAIPNDFSDMYDDFYSLLVERIPYEEKSVIPALEGILELYRILTEGSTQKHDNEVPTRTDPKILEILEWTRQHMTENIQIDDVAKNFHYSKYYFCRFFKKHTGKTYNEYLNALRVDRAIELMKQGKSATYCCMECGFEDLSYFIRLFKRITGYTTNEYKNKLLNLNNEKN